MISPSKSRLAVTEPFVLSNEVENQLGGLFKLLSDRNRVQILLLLNVYGELNVRDLSEKLGQSQPAVSHHLALLRLGELIEMRRVGKYNFYSAKSNRLQTLLDTFLAAISRPYGERQLEQRMQLNSTK